MADFSTLTITEVILHQIPAGTRDETAVTEAIDYAQAPVQLAVRDRNFIEKRLSSTLVGNARPVIEDTDSAIGTPDLIRSVLDGSGDLVTASCDLALALHRKQKPISPAGLVMVILGSLDGETCLLVSKMEQEEGMRMEPIQVGGLRTYEAQYLRDLILGQRTKVYKVGVFQASGAQAGAKLRGEVVDPQSGAGGVADFFVEFLGCEFVHRADWQTDKFMKVAQKVINRVTKLDPEKGADYQMALLAELRSPAQDLSPQDFASHHLEPQHRDEFLSQIQATGLPVKGFRKDTKLVSASIRRVRFQTERGATVVIPPPMWEDGSAFVEAGELGDNSRLVINDKIKRINGAGGPKAIDGES